MTAAAFFSGGACYGVTMRAAWCEVVGAAVALLFLLSRWWRSNLRFFRLMRLSLLLLLELLLVMWRSLESSGVRLSIWSRRSIHPRWWWKAVIRRKWRSRSRSVAS